MFEEYPLKHVRLQQLEDAGLNVADFICWAPGCLNIEELKTFLEKHGRISCRHFHEDEKAHFKCPVLYDQTDLKTIIDFCSEHNKQFYTLCNEAIKLDDSICAGNILVLNEETFFVEYFNGSGTPRDIETKGPSELKVYNKSGYAPAEGEKPPDAVLDLVRKARRFKPLENKPYIVEFSVYPYPIGRKQVKPIVWEWRWGWLHYQLQANKVLLQINQSLQEKITRLGKTIINMEQRFQYKEEFIRDSSF